MTPMVTPMPTMTMTTLGDDTRRPIHDYIGSLAFMPNEQKTQCSKQILKPIDPTGFIVNWPNQNEFDLFCHKINFNSEKSNPELKLRFSNHSDHFFRWAKVISKKFEHFTILLLFIKFTYLILNVKMFSGSSYLCACVGAYVILQI